MLIHQTEVTVRFNEADPLGIVWHGHYIRYFEDGREDFGRKYGVSYLDFHRNGLVVPIVSVHCDYKRPLRYGDSIIVETRFIPSAAAKLRFEYNIFDKRKNSVVAIGWSLQVFTDATTFKLQLTMPTFFEQWMKKWELSI